MGADHAALSASWKRAAGHLNAAEAHLANLPGDGLSPPREFLEHNELGLAFDCLVHLGHILDLPLSY
ncbi:hypothetical protein [Nocardia sp. CS682]|uniref:hypothetical protein n=1 Tax=Nocardia sp. CS682 TaxID=1047172 RepID=UPI001074A676|nr:hypothetical protein [Nocardia sp. CS682]